MKYSRHNLPNRFVGAFSAAAVAFGVLAVAGNVRGQGGESPPAAGTSAVEPLRPIARPADVPAANVAPGGATVEVDARSIAEVARQGATPLVERAASELARHRSIAAKVRHRADLYGRELIGSGEYAQGPSSSRLLRYELRMQVNEWVVNLLQVGDGRHLWTSRQLNDEPVIERIDVDRVLAAAGQGGPAAGDLFASIGIGGLPQLLASLRRDFEFREVFQAQLGPLPVYGVRGTWKPAALTELLPLQEAHIAAGNPADLRQLRPHVPDEVVLYLGADDVFPYRIEYCRTAATRAANQSAKGQGAGAQTGAERPLLVLEFFEVRFDVPLEERLFQFTAGSRPYADVTNAFIQRSAQ